MNFYETKQKMLDEFKKQEKPKVTFNESYFNELATALVNTADYQKTELIRKNGEMVEVVSEPVKDFRKPIIGSVAKAAGCDAADVEKLVETHQFPTIPMYDIVDSVLKEYMRCGKKFQFSNEDDFEGSIELSNQPATIKDVRKPGSDVVKKQKQEEYMKLKSKSTCPANRRKDL